VLRRVRGDRGLVLHDVSRDSEECGDQQRDGCGRSAQSRAREVSARIILVPPPVHACPYKLGVSLGF
jgi:hypothetical protein